MKKPLGPVALTLLALAVPALYAEELKPLSVQDKAKLEELLKNFDPATYEFRFQWVDSKGKLQNGRLGRAIGLGSVRQGETTKAGPDQGGKSGGAYGVAGASLRARGLGPNQTINGFKGDAMAYPAGDALKLKLDELDALLKKYTR